MSKITKCPDEKTLLAHLPEDEINTSYYKGLLKKGEVYLLSNSDKTLIASIRDWSTEDEMLYSTNINGSRKNVGFDTLKESKEHLLQRFDFIMANQKKIA